MVTDIPLSIYKLLESSDGFTNTFQQELSEEVTRRVADKLRYHQDKGYVRLSKVGPSCPRAYWYSIHHPEMAEPLPPWARIKFQYGHILEALVIALMKQAGHRVEGEQDELTLLGVTGHRDCVVDGAVCDIKSASSLQFKKIKEGGLENSDDFGYLVQLDAYILASALDPLVTIKDKGYIIAIDKQLGHICTHEHYLRTDYIKRCVSRAKEISGLTQPPPCECGTRPEGNSGNIGLDVKASYSDYKYTCFPHLRTFLYAGGPKYLTVVKRVPDVPEISSKGLHISG